MINFVTILKNSGRQLDQKQQQRISPNSLIAFIKCDKIIPVFSEFPEEIQQLIPFDPKCFDRISPNKLALLALRYMESDSDQGMYFILSRLQSRTEVEIGLFFKELYQLIPNDQHISLGLLKKTIAAMKRKNISLEKYPLICAVIHLENGLELAKLLVAHGAKILTELYASSPINYYLTRNSKKLINMEILDFLEQHGDDFFKRYPFIKSLIETGDYSKDFLSYYMSFTEENIEEKLSNLSLSNWKINIEQLTKVLLKKEFEVKHFIKLIENILLNSEYSPNDDNKIITIFECLKVHVVNLATWENNGDTLLHMLFKGNNWNLFKVAEYLMDNKVDPLKLNADGKYAEHLA